MGALTLLAVLGLALGVGRVARAAHAQSFFFTVAFLILALYVGALVGVLWWTSLAIQVAGITMLGLEALRLTRQPMASALPLPFGVLALLCSWFWIVHGDDQYMLYDEYSHWGIFIKEMLALDGFWTGETSSIHPRYPPGAPLWQYLFNSLLPPSESRIYLAHFVLLLAPLLMLWNNLRWSQVGWSVAILALVLLAIANFGLGVSTLYVDATIGVWYVGTLLAAIADENLGLRRVALYAAPLAVIALLKDAGVAFAASGAVIIAALYCHRALASRRPWSAVRQTGTALAVLLLPMLLCVQVWSWNRDAVGAPHEVYSVDGIVSGIADQPGSANLIRDAEIGRRLNEVFLHQQISNSAVSWEYNEFSYDLRERYTDTFRLTTCAMLVAFIIWWVTIGRYLLTGESRRRWLIVASTVLVTAAAYIVSLHLSYRFAFGERGLDLPSYVRYVHAVALPMLLLSFSPLLPALQGVGPHPPWRILGRAVPKRATIFAAAAIALYAFETPYLQRILEANPTIPTRATLEPILERIRTSVGASKLWIYFPGDRSNDFFGRMVQYLLVPTPTAVERSERFLQADAGRVAAVWAPFQYVWIADLPSPEAGIGLARFSGGTAGAGLYRVQSEGGVLMLEALGEHDQAE
jgi:hypothetical protein